MTKPTRGQERACDLLARALLDIAEAARLDGRPALGVAEFTDLGTRLARASSAFGLDAIAARSVEARCRSLGLRPGSGELLVLMDGGPSPPALLILDDDGFRAAVAAMEAELGEV